MSTQIVVSAVVVRDAEGRVLVVRKRGTSALMFPGGKREAGESAAHAAVREFAEELGVAIEVERLDYLGTFTAPAANEHGSTVRADVYEHPWVAVDAPRAEIEHVEWVDPAAAVPNLAPLLRDAVFPLLSRATPPTRRWCWHRNASWTSAPRRS